MGKSKISDESKSVKKSKSKEKSKKTKEQLAALKFEYKKYQKWDKDFDRNNKQREESRSFKDA